MKTIIDLQGNRMSRAALDEKIAGVLDQVGKLAEGEPALRQLAEVLRDQTPHSFFVAPSAEQLVAWVTRFHAFLRERKGLSQFDYLPQDDGGGFLLSLTDDAPFLLHSLQLCLSRRQIPFQVVCHPILRIERQDGVLQSLAPAGSGTGALESFVVLELEPGAEVDRDELLGEVEAAVLAVQQVRRDRDALQEQVRMLAGLSPEAIRPFWEWLLEDNFVLFSYKRLQLGGQGQIEWVCEEPTSALGLSWEVVELVPGERIPLARLNPRFRGRMLRPTRIVVEEVDRRSPIYRDRHLTSIGLRETTAAGEVEHTLLGLFTPKASEEGTLAVPALRRRIEKALDSLGIPVGCHDYRKTLTIFNSFPKVELFFMVDEEILAIVRSFTNLYRYGVVKVVPAHSLAVRGLTLLVIMPADFYSVTVVERMDHYLRRFFSSTQIDSRIIHLSSDYLSLQFSVQLDAFDVEFDVERLERALTSLSRPWTSTLRLLISRRCDPPQRQRLWKRYGSCFPEEYQHVIHPRYALRDIAALERLLQSGEDDFDLWGPFSQESYFRLQYYSLGKSYLNDLMPYLDNLGLRVIDEVDFTFSIDGRDVYIKSFAVQGGDAARPLGEVGVRLLEALHALRSGNLENDPLNRLLISTGLAWQQIDVFRAYRNYYFQLGSPYTKLRVANALIDNPQIALLLWRYFVARFEPGRSEEISQREEEALMPLRFDLLAALQQVRDVNADNILRILFNLIDSTVRTNFFLRQQHADYFVSFKISAIGIIDMPAPRPLYETYVHSARMEGIHLRGGKVARGGIRWSDRPDDFRTEILGLMKTQMTKNALIVPVGSKGGFIVKTPYTSRERGLELSKAAYQTLMRGLLDLCDNRVGQEIVRPQGVVAYDGDDPYLVVAADKGTAHLPDTANGVSADYGFWLKDAFASGGSKGYDHKQLGITARGAWECVKRHFRELGTDIQKEPFTVVGIGDMSGDVFGNGMLLSRQIRLLAAFDHRHIFLDPDPDPEASWRERQRLFNLPRSSWDDYDRSLISAGGGVFSRSDKEIPLSAEARAWLGVRHDSIDPEGLISLLLVARVDLLWNGGIGTYVKASFEKHADAGDRANDGLRIDATSLHARVVGEGGNLGLTQKARIEYALGGGRINTDAIDNSAGVDCSDHEVNLKIFLHHLMEEGVVSGESERDRLLEEMTDDVSLKVLRNNYTQSLCLSLDELRCRDAVGDFLDLTQRLVDAGLLDRGGESLPVAKTVYARPSLSLARPELAILLAYSKMQLYQSLLESELPDNPGVHDLLVDYFPQAVQQQFAGQIAGHPLAREIAATMITNYIVDRAGASFCDRLVRSTGASLPQVARAYLALDRTLDAEPLRLALLGLDNRAATGPQYRQLLALEGCLADLVQWGLNDGFDLTPEPDSIERLRGELQDYLQGQQNAGLQGVQPETQERLQALTRAGLDPALAPRLQALGGLGAFLPVAALSRQSGQPVAEVTVLYHQLWSRFELVQVLDTLARVTLHDQWDRMAARVLAVQFDAAVFDLAAQVLAQGEGAETFLGNRRSLLQGYHSLRQRMAGGSPANLHPFTVLLGALRRLIGRS